MFVLFVSSTSQSQVLLTDDFSGTTGTALTANGWTQFAAGTALNIGNSGVTFSGIARSGVGNSVTLTTSGQGVYKSMSPTTVNTGIVYTSAIINVTAASTGNYFLALGNSVSNIRTKIFIKSGTSGKFQIGLQKDIETATYNATTELNIGTSYLVVLKYEFVSGASNNDKISLFVYSSSSIPSIESPTPFLGPLSPANTDISSAFMVNLRQGSGSPTINVDGLRVTQDWVSAIGVNVNTAPSVSSPVSSAYTNNTATAGGSLTSLGWTNGGIAGTISEQGVVWNTIGNPSTADNKVVSGSGTNSFTSNLTGLPSGTQIFYKAYAINATGIAYSSESSFYTLSSEPSAHVTGLIGNAETLTSVRLNWATGNSASGYIILYKQGSTPTGVPVDGSSYTVGATIGDATVGQIVTNPTDTTGLVSGLTQNLTYHFTVIPFGYNGSQALTYNYKTNSPPVVSVTTVLANLSSESDIAETSGFTYPTNFSYNSFQSSDITNLNSLIVWDISVRDGGADLVDSDALSTDLNSLTVSVTNNSMLRSLALYDGSTELSEVTVTGSTVTFSGLNVSAADNTLKSLQIRATFKSIVTDNTQFQFTISSASVVNGTSAFITSNAGGAISSISGDNNKLEVTANHLFINSQPADQTVITINTSVSPAIVVHALDVNNILDLDFTSSVSLTNSGSGFLTNSTQNAVAGIATFSTVTNPTIETVNFTASSGSLTTAVTNNFRFLPAQTSVFAEAFGSTNTGQNVAANESGNLFDNTSLTYSSTTATQTVVGFGSTAPLSSGYSGASGTKYLLVASPNASNELKIDGINASSYTNLTLSFGFYAGAGVLTPATVANIGAEYSVNSGSSWSPLSISSPLATYQAGGGGSWTLVSGVSLPSNAEISGLQVRFKTIGTTASSNPTSFKLDDIKLSGSLKYASEPTVASTLLNFTNLTNVSYTLNWTSGNGGKRIIVAKQGSAVSASPTDANSYTANSVFGLGSDLGGGNFVVYDGSSNSVSLTSLTQGATYHFAVFEYNGSGSSANYFATSLTGSQATYPTAYASLSNAYIVNGTESDSISSVINQPSPLASTDGASVFNLFIQDGNGTNDFDVLTTIVDSLKFTSGAQNEVSNWSSVIKTAALFDGTTLIAEAIIGQNSLTFKPSIPISVSDNGSKTLSVRLSLKNSGIVDNQKLQFNLASSGIFVGSSGSQFGSVTTTETIGSKNKIYVQATKIRFTAQPTLTKVGNSVTPALTVEVTDANLNKALRYNSTVNLTSNTALDGASVNSASFNSGIATLNSVKPGAANAQAVLYANSGILTQAVSDTFTVYALAAEPTVASSSLQFTTVGNTSVDLSWTNGNGAKRIVVAKSGSAVNATVLDEATYSANSVFGSGSQIDTGNYVIYSGTGNSVSVTGLSQNQTYHFAVYEFSGSGISTNYLTSSVLTGSQMTLNVAYASLSEIYIQNGTESDSISSIINDASPLASTEGAKVFDVFVQDGNGISDFDSLPTVVDSLKFTSGAQNEVSDFSSTIKTAALFDGTTLVAEGLIGQNSLTFKPSTPISVSDNGSITLSVRLSLKNSGIVDNQKIQFSLASSGIFTGNSGSQLGSVSTTETNGNKNKIYVQATQIRFTAQPTLTKVGNSITPALTVEVTDANLNKALRYNTTVNLTSNTALDGASVNSASFNSGIATLNSVKPGAANNQAVLYANSGILTQAVSDTFTVYSLAAEPTVASSSLQFTTVGNTSVDLSWTNGNGAKRIVVAKSGSAVNATVLDETTYTANSVFGNGSQIDTGNYVVYSGTGNSISVTGLSQNQTYHFAVYEFSGSGISTNYLTSSVLTGSQMTLNVAYASLSEIYIQNGTESDSISSIINDASPLASTDGSKVFDLFVQDGNGINDFDSLPTVVDSLKFTAGTQNEVSDFSSTIKTAALFDGTTLIAAAIIGQNSLTFKPSTPISVSDNGSKTLSVRLSLKNSGIVDNQKLQFNLASSGIFVGNSGSQFGSVTTTETIGSKNKIYVQATKIRFTVQPTLTKVGNSVTPALTVEVTDANLNKALRYNTTVNLTSNIALDGASVNSASFNSGIATLNSVKPGAANNQAVLYANSGSLTQAVSDTFTVYALAAEPTVAASNLQFISVGNTSMKLVWNKGNGSNRIVIAKEGSSVTETPADENSYSANSQFGSGSDLGTGNFAVYSGADSSVIITGLSPNTEYFFSIYEFNGSGISLNYASSSVVGSKTTLSVAFASESSAKIVVDSESSEISSLANNSGPLSSTDGIHVFGIEIKDGSSFPDFDSKPTQLNALLINQSESNSVADWSSAVKAAGLFYNSTLISSGNVNSNGITFSIPSGFTVPDDSSRVLSVRISLKENGLVDGQSFGFAVDASSFGATSSDFSSQFSSFASSSTSEGSNKIQVTATKLNLAFASKPTSVSIAVLPAPVVTITDANQNIDTDFNGLIEAASNNSFDGASVVSKSAVSGTVTFDNLIFSTVNFKTALTFSHSGMTEVKSDSFMVFVKSVPSAGDIVINQLNSNFKNENVQMIELVNKTDKYFDLSDLKINVLNPTGFAMDFNGNLSGILFPNRFWLLATKPSVKLSETDSIAADAVIASVLATNQQVGLVRNDNTVIDGVSFGTISNAVYTEGNSATQNGLGTTLKRKINAFDTNNNSTDFISVSDNGISVRNHSSYFFGSGSTVPNETFNDLWLSGNVSAPNGVSVSSRFGIENGKLDVSGNSLNLSSSAQVINTNSWIDNKITSDLSGTGIYNFDIGNSTAAFNVQVDLAAVPTNATNLQVSFTDTDAGNSAPMPSGILSYWTGGYWAIGSNGINTTGEFDLSVETDSIKGFILENQLGNYVILQRVDSESDWIVAGQSVSNSGTILTAAGVSGFGEFTLGEIDPETVPVEVTGLSVYQDNSSAKLVWSTITETNNNGFSIDKRIKGNNKPDWESVGFVNGKGTTTQKQNYQFTDVNADQPCEYRLSQTDLSGKVTVLGTINFDGIVRKFELVGNYPNPFNPETTVLFRLASESNVKISIYNNLGQVVRVVKDENMKAGSHEIKIIATDLSSGVYFYEVLAGENTRAIKKMVLVK